MKRFTSILAHVDTRLEVHPLLDRAVEMARAHGAGLTIVDVVPDVSWSLWGGVGDYEAMRQSFIAQKTRLVDELVAELRPQGVAVEGKVLMGKTSAEIIAEVSRSRHDLVMKAAKGPGSRRMGFLGTSATRLMRFCPCTVWAFRPPQPTVSGLVVAAVDAVASDERHAELNRDILEVAGALGRGTPHVVHAWSLYGENLIKDYMKRDEFEALVKDGEQRARTKMAELLSSFGLPVDAPEVHFLRGSEDEEIAKFVSDNGFEALVIGTVGRSGISGMLVGNTAEMLLDRVQCSVVAVKPSDVQPQPPK